MNKRVSSSFTLVELLTVMGVMAVLIAIVTPAAVQILRGSNITQSGEMVGDQFVLARQAAMTSNRTVQVRFYELPVTSADRALNYAGMQSFRMEESGTATPLTKLQQLRAGVVFATDTDGASETQLHSTLINIPGGGSPSISGTEKLPTFPNNGTQYKYRGFQFLPSGAADLDPTAASPAGGWFVTLVEAN